MGTLPDWRIRSSKTATNSFQPFQAGFAVIAAKNHSSLTEMTLERWRAIAANILSSNKPQTQETTETHENSTRPNQPPPPTAPRRTRNARKHPGRNRREALA